MSCEMEKTYFHFSQPNYFIIHLKNRSLPLKGGYFSAGSNHVGVDKTALEWEKVLNENLP